MLTQNTNKCLFFDSELFIYLHDYELQHEVQLTDVSRR